MGNSSRQNISNYWGRILENSFDEIYVFDAVNYRFLQVSRGALKNLGYSMAEMRDLTAADIKPELSLAEFIKLLTPLKAKEKERVVFFTVHKRKNGSHYPVEVRLQMINDKPRAVFIAIILDITERVEAEHKIRAREKIFETMAKSSPVGIFRTDVYGHCIYTNERWLEIAGMKAGQPFGEGWANALHPGDRDKVFTAWYEAARGKQPFCAEMRFKRPDGKVTWVIAHAVAEVDDNDKVVGYIGSVTDINKQKEVEEALNKSIHEWNYAMDYFEDPMTLVSLDDKIVRANKTFYKNVGLTPEQVIGRDPAEIYHPHGDKAGCPVCQARNERRDARIVMEADDPRNQLGRPVEKIVRIVRDENGEPQSILVASHDLTHQRVIENELRHHQEHLEKQVAIRTRELEISNKELESFSYSIAHDLRSPLRSITSFSQIVMEDAGDRLTVDEQDNLQRVVNAGKNMTEIIDDILELSRVSRLNFDRVSVDMSELAQSSIRHLRDSEPRADINISITGGLKAQGDRKLLYTMLDNLLGNAWKYTGKTANAEIEFGTTKQNNEMVYFVKDNGIGFDMQYANKLFGVFQRLHRSDDFEGTGIGLATVQRIIHRHGGRVWAEAEPSKGATFYFSLP